MVGPSSSIVGGNDRYDRLDIPMQEQEETSKGITIGKDVWIGVIAPNSGSARIPE